MELYQPCYCYLPWPLSFQIIANPTPQYASIPYQRHQLMALWLMPWQHSCLLTSFSMTARSWLGQECVCHFWHIQCSIDDPQVSCMSTSLHDSNLTLATGQITQFPWAAHVFICGHFMSFIDSRTLPFDIIIAADDTEDGGPSFEDFLP